MNFDRDSETKVEIGKYKNSDVLKIQQVDEMGRNLYDYPIFSFGRYKAKILLKHIEEIEAFANSTPEKTYQEKSFNNEQRRLFNEDDIPF